MLHKSYLNKTISSSHAPFFGPHRRSLSTLGLGPSGLLAGAVFPVKESFLVQE